uniref:hypothetical protein Ycf80 n=1 Tax=Gloiopeltis furcata TaxID=42017 RepID=UPI0028D2E376|nr:hypothetical protein Ycf80 [Gloiopeltis furcata]WMP13860.1 hypothetical protein Ycf80 [Gloiopeltis furcata]
MSLFNLIFIRSLSHNNFEFSRSLELNHANMLVSRNRYSTELSSVSEQILLKRKKLSIDYTLNSIRKKFRSRDFVAQLIEQYWQETVFVSPVNKLSEYYTRKLKSANIATKQDEYKKFVFDFSKALVTERVETSLTESNRNHLTHNKKVTTSKYIWRKGLNFFSLEQLRSYIFNRSKLGLSNNKQLKVIQQLKLNKLPIFTVVNNLNQIIVAEPSNELIVNQSILDRFYQLYHDKFVPSRYKRNLYEGLFFVNPQDALEYKENIKQKYSTYNKQHNLHLFAAGLDFYHKLIHASPSRVKFHLIPDLKELGDLLRKYQYLSNVSFYNKQKHGQKLFQGQPIYLIQSIKAKNRINKKIEPVHYIYEFSENNKNSNYEPVFMNYNIALKAWQQFKERKSEYLLPKKPKVLVYNLESFLKDMDIYSSKKFLFLPVEESYRFMKVNDLTKLNNPVYQTLVNRLLYCKIMTQRIFWSLTSRQPTKW